MLHCSASKCLESSLDIHPYQSGFLTTSCPIFLGHTLWMLNLVWIFSYLYENSGYLFFLGIYPQFWVSFQSHYSMLLHYAWWLAILSCCHSQALSNPHKCESQTSPIHLTPCFVLNPGWTRGTHKTDREMNLEHDSSRFHFPSVNFPDKWYWFIHLMILHSKYILITNLWVLSWF